jgi:hypothetical protein
VFKKAREEKEKELDLAIEVEMKLLANVEAGLTPDGRLWMKPLEKQSEGPSEKKEELGCFGSILWASEQVISVSPSHVICFWNPTGMQGNIFRIETSLQRNLVHSNFPSMSPYLVSFDLGVVFLPYSHLCIHLLSS